MGCHGKHSRSRLRWHVVLAALAPLASLALSSCAWLAGPPSQRLQRLPRRAQNGADKSDASWEPPEKIYSNAIRALPGSATAYRKVLPLGKAVLRKRAKLVKAERISREKSQNVAEELVSVMRGPNLPGRTFKGGFLTAPHLGTPSRLIVLEDPPAGVEALSETERVEQGREEPFSCKAVFNPQWRPVSNVTSVYWERDPSIPGYRALVERYNEVQVTGFDPKGNEVDFVAKGWQARLVQQAADVLDGFLFIDRCIKRSLCHLDARDDPLPSDCPPLGVSKVGGRPPLSDADVEAAVGGGSRGMLGFLPSFIAPAALLVGSLILRLRADPVNDFSAPEVAAAAKELRDALSAGDNPLGVAGPQFGKKMQIVAIGESEEAIERLSTRARISEEHRPLKPTVLVNPVITPKAGCAEAFFWERSASVPGYEGIVGRALEVEVKAFSEEGRKVNFVAKGWQARQLQHAVDMLDGVLYVDRMETKSFRRDKVEEDLPEGVPYGVRAAKVARTKPATGKRSARARR